MIAQAVISLSGYRHLAHRVQAHDVRVRETLVVLRPLAAHALASRRPERS
jgi:hypothetical protein